MSAPTTLLRFYNAREVVGDCPAGVQGTVSGIAVLTYAPCLTFSARFLVLTERVSPVGWSQSALIAPVEEEQ